MLIFLGLPCRRLSGHDGVRGVGLCEGQDPPHGPLRHLQLPPDSGLRDFGPPQLNCSPLVIIF
jgi:hypothetical protein